MTIMQSKHPKKTKKHRISPGHQRRRWWRWWWWVVVLVIHVIKSLKLKTKTRKPYFFVSKTRINLFSNWLKIKFNTIFAEHVLFSNLYLKTKNQKLATTPNSPLANDCGSKPGRRPRHISSFFLGLVLFFYQ